MACVNTNTLTHPAWITARYGMRACQSNRPISTHISTPGAGGAPNIANAIEKKNDSFSWSERAQILANRMVEQSWDPEAGLFWAKKDGFRINVRTPFNLFPLITGHLPAEITDRLVSHLTDPSQFWSRYPVPSVALDDPTYSPTQMWRGANLGECQLHVD